ncbi:MAG: glycosyltransferase family 2 protein [Pseudomonadota bacterium]
MTRGAPTPPRVTVIIVNYNSGHDLRDCVDTLLTQTFQAFEILIIDNASADGSIEALGDPPAKAKILRQRENLGFAGGNNLAVRAATTPLVVLLNPDTLAEPDWLEWLVDAADRYPDVAMFGSTQIDLARPDRLDGAGDVMHGTGFMYRGHHGAPAETLPGRGEAFAPCAAAALYRRDAFLGAGGFDEQFFCYCEDVDLAYRLRLSGHRCYQIAEARVRHKGSASTSKRSDFALYHGSRNRIWTFVKNTPGPIFWPLIPIHAGLTLILMLMALRRPKELRAIIRGVRDGLKGLPVIWRDRRAISRLRTARLGDIARALTWSPMKLARREADIRPIEGGPGDAP